MYSKDFLTKFINKFDKLPPDQIKKFITELSDEQKLFQCVFESISEGMVVTDKKSKILYINHFARRILNLSKEKGIENNLFNILIDDKLKEIFSKAINEYEKIDNLEFQIEEPMKIILNINVQHIVENGKIIGYIYLLLDITEKKSRLLKQQQIDSLASLAHLTAGVAHEIKNPLGSLDLHLQLIERYLQKNKMDKKSELTNLTSVLKEEISRLNSIVNDFLFSVRPLRANKEINDLNECIKESISFLKYELKEHKIEIKTKYDSAVPMLMLDKRYIHQALLNIIQNSISSIAGTERSGLIKITTLFQDNKILLSIFDNGKGIPREQLNKIFEPYFTTKQFGTGLGLTIVYKILKEHDAEITMESKEGDWALTTITFNYGKFNPLMIENKINKKEKT